MEPREDDINEFLIGKTEDIERKYISKASLLMYEDMQYTKNHVEKERVDKSFVTSFYYYTDLDEWETRAFFDAFVMAYFPNILKRDKDLLGIDELYDVYGNKIVILATEKLSIIIKGKIIPEEVEHLYDRLIFEIIKKVRTYGADMEIGRWN